MRCVMIAVVLVMLLGSQCVGGRLLDADTMQAVSGGCAVCHHTGRMCALKWCPTEGATCTTCQGDSRHEYCTASKDGQTWCTNLPPDPQGCGYKIYTGTCRLIIGCEGRGSEASFDDCPRTKAIGSPCAGE